MLNNLAIILPELILFIGAMGLLMIGAFSKTDATRTVDLGAVAILALAAAAAGSYAADAPATAFNGAFIMDSFASLMKVLTFIATAIAILMSQSFLKLEKLARFEYAVLLLLAAAGMGMMISANDLIALYMGIELQSLALYVIAAINRDSLRSTEAGLKYFVLGALSSGMFLYGASLIYGFSGSTNFNDIAAAFQPQDGQLPMAQVLGLVFLLAGLAFKISAVPFHMWTPDVYEGAPTSVTAFFASAPKLAGMAIFLRIMMTGFENALVAWQQIIILLSVASMALGAFAAIGQQNIKRLMAFSSIGHMGFALVGFAAASEAGVASAVLYMALYVVMTLGTFACILSMRRDSGPVERIDDLAGLSQTRPFMAFCLAVMMFSLAGIPPMAGFFGKLYVFMAAVNEGLYVLAIIGVLTSVIGAFYYLRIVKIMYFDEPADAFDRTAGREIGAIMAVAGMFTLLFFVFPSPIVEGAGQAAAVLFASG